MHKLDHYVGRIVRLKDRAYEQIVRRGRRLPPSTGKSVA